MALLQTTSSRGKVGKEMKKEWYRVFSLLWGSIERQTGLQLLGGSTTCKIRREMQETGGVGVDAKSAEFTKGVMKVRHRIWRESESYVRTGPTSLNNKMRNKERKRGISDWARGNIKNNAVCSMLETALFHKPQGPLRE